MYSSVQSLSHVWVFVTPWTAARQASLFFTISQSLLKLMSIELVMPSSHLILCHPLLLPPSIFPSIRVFSNESVLHIRWPKYWSFSFSISTSFKWGWFPLRLTGLVSLQSKGLSRVFSTVQKHQFFGTQLSSPTPGVYSNSCPLSWWCHPAISSSVIPFSSHLQTLPKSGSFQMSQLFASGGQSIGVSASTSVLQMNIQG